MLIEGRTEMVDVFPYQEVNSHANSHVNSRVNSHGNSHVNSRLSAIAKSKFARMV